MPHIPSETIRLWSLPTNINGTPVPVFPTAPGELFSSGRIDVGNYAAVRGVVSVDTGIPLDVRITQISQDRTNPNAVTCQDVIQFQVPIDANNVLAGIDSYCFLIAIFAPYVRVDVTTIDSAGFLHATVEGVSSL